VEMSKRTKIALGLMAELASREKRKPLVLASVAHKLDTSTSYLEAITARLRAAGLVEAVRGPGGGYLLARDASQISILEIVLTVEASPCIFQDVLSRRLKGGEADELTQSLFERTESAAASFLREMRLSDLASSANAPSQASIGWTEFGRSDQWSGERRETSEEVCV
jgi:Rrf2 family transcriptional regulator, iron-sulfur cluster assembly transcription factor